MTTGNQVTPTTTCSQARVQLYQASQRPTLRDGEWIPTNFGRCRVTGRLGQRHADLVETLLFVAEKRRDISDGGVELLVDPHKLRSGLSDSRYSKSQIEKLLTDLRGVTVEIDTPELEKNGTKIIGGIIDHAIPSIKTRKDPLTGGERNLLKVRLGIALAMLLDHDLTLFYDPRPIARLSHGISQAVARHILTHKNAPRNGWYVDTLIRAVAGDINGCAIRNARRRIKSDAEGLLKIGIEVEGDRITRIQPPKHVERATAAR